MIAAATLSAEAGASRSCERPHANRGLERELSMAQEPPSNAAARRAFYERIGASNLAPLWEALAALVPVTPTTPILPVHWRYADVRPYVMEAGTLISAREAERRVLVLENPALRGRSCITQSLYAGLQLILPGEIAPSHRHTQSALRLVLDGEGAYTAVDGERTTMRRGDFIITPPWTWHDHGNLGADPVVWLDGLDIPIVRFFDAGFAEKSESEYQAELRPEGDSLARFGSNMVPVDYAPRAGAPTPLFVYPFAKTMESLRALAKSGVDEHFGCKLRYVNPATGASPMATIGAFVQLLPDRFRTKSYRSTDATVYVCLAGEGAAELAEESFAFVPNDVFVVPSWHTLRLRARSETILFSFSDRPAQQALGLWRQQKLAA
jgi:gentisate 1,2-dioxygenase